MLSKELEILKHIEELYKHDVTDDEFLAEMAGKETLVMAWQKAFSEYELSDVIQAIDEYFAKRNNRTPPRIPQIEALLNVNGAKKETPIELSGETYIPDYSIRYMDEDVQAGNCHHNRYYYDEALRQIRANYYPFIKDIQNPTHADMTEVLEDICEKRSGKKWEFLSRNDLISEGYDMEKTYSVSDLMKTMFKRID